MIKTYNIFSEINGDRRIVSSFEVEGEKTQDDSTQEEIDEELEELANIKFEEFIDSLSLEEE